MLKHATVSRITNWSHVLSTTLLLSFLKCHLVEYNWNHETSKQDPMPRYPMPKRHWNTGPSTWIKWWLSDKWLNEGFNDCSREESCIGSTNAEYKITKTAIFKTPIRNVGLGLKTWIIPSKWCNYLRNANMKNEIGEMLSSQLMSNVKWMSLHKSD